MSLVCLRGQTHALKLRKNGIDTVGIKETHYDWCSNYNCFERLTCAEFTLFFPEVVSGLDRKSVSHVDRLLLVHRYLVWWHRDGRLVSRIQTAYVIWRMLRRCRCLMTTLDQLRKNHISIECKCGYSALLPITELLNYVKPETTLEQVSHIARCTRCQRKGEIDFRLHYVCGVWALSSFLKDRTCISLRHHLCIR